MDYVTYLYYCSMLIGIFFITCIYNIMNDEKHAAKIYTKTICY
jgi:hypothetical protein